MNHYILNGVIKFTSGFRMQDIYSNYCFQVVKNPLARCLGLVNFHIWASWNNQASKKIYLIWTNLSKFWYLLIFSLFVTFSRRVSKKNMQWMSPNSSMTTFPCFRSLPSHCLVSLSLNKCVMCVWAILLVSECIKITFILTLIINR